jgi:type III secretion protein J
MFLQALSGELSRTISSIDGILDSRVHINIPQHDDLADRDGRPAPSASVLVKYRIPADAGKAPPPPPVGEEQVKQLVARAVQDLRPENVSVVMTPAAMPGGAELAGPGNVEVLGIRMAADSVNAFRGVLAVLVLIIVALATYIVISKARELKAPASHRPRIRPGV